MTVVVDASIVIAGLTDQGPVGHWALGVVDQHSLLAPQVLPVEVLSGLRRLVRAGRLATARGRDAVDDLGTLEVELFPILPVRDRVWELRDDVTPYDASYVALAEAYDCPVATLDHRLVSAVGPRCEFVTP